MGNAVGTGDGLLTAEAAAGNGCKVFVDESVAVVVHSVAALCFDLVAGRPLELTLLELGAGTAGDE